MESTAIHLPPTPLVNFSLGVFLFFPYVSLTVVLYIEITAFALKSSPKVATWLGGLDQMCLDVWTDLG
jgi:hypothetical protein